MMRTWLFIAGCFWCAVSGSPALATDTAPPASAYNLPIWNTDSFSIPGIEDFRLRFFREPFTPLGEDGSDASRGLQTRYQLSFAGNGLELSGGYLPGTKKTFEPRVEPDTYLGYINLKVPVHRFFLTGGAFFGQNMEGPAIAVHGLPDERGLEKPLFGFQIAGGYRLSDSFSILAGWGQAAQEHDVSRVDLKAWYLQAQISLGWRMSFTPHVGFVDFTNREGEKIQEEAFYCGARWQINF